MRADPSKPVRSAASDEALPVVTLQLLKTPESRRQRCGIGGQLDGPAIGEKLPPS